MKRILITGANSYIGTSVEKWLKKYPNEYQVDTLDVKENGWRSTEFTQYDTILHVAGIVHLKEKEEMKELYYKVNRDLPVEVANKAKLSGVNQFIFMSTMSVYGEEGDVSRDIVITKSTKPNPKSHYGKSKYEAELELNKLISPSFKVLTLRPPMVYGPNCPGNYARLEKLALKTPVFPMVNNRRSMIHIDKLCESIKNYIDNVVSGVQLPQDEQLSNTSLLVKKIAEENGKKVYLSKFLGCMVNIFGNKIGLVNKVFGTLIYE